MDTSQIPSVGDSVATTVKAWYLSETVWSAILQSVVGFLTSIIMMLNNGITVESTASFFVGVKGLLDLRQRFLTTQPIK